MYKSILNLDKMTYTVKIVCYFSYNHTDNEWTFIKQIFNKYMKYNIALYRLTEQIFPLLIYDY